MYQKITVLGYLGGDPEMRYMPDGTAVTNFSLATSRNWTQNGQRQSETTWFRVSAWGSVGEAVHQYLKKGSMALVDGVLQADKETGGPRIWNAANGTTRASFEIRASSVTFVSGGGSAGPAVEEDFEDDEDDDIPF